MSVYIILGIGVDDIYVFLDAFKQTANLGVRRETDICIH